MATRDFKPQTINVYRFEDCRLIMGSDVDGQGENLIRRNYGLDDLYVDPAHPDHDHIEKKLSVPESQAAIVIAKMVAALDSPEKKAIMPRKDLNTL